MFTITRSCGITIGGFLTILIDIVLIEANLGIVATKTTILVTDRITFCLHGCNQFMKGWNSFRIFTWVKVRRQGIMFVGDHDLTIFPFNTIVRTIIAHTRVHFHIWLTSFWRLFFASFFWRILCRRRFFGRLGLRLFAFFFCRRFRTSGLRLGASCQG